MKFYIKSLLLWAKNREKGMRRIDFSQDKINVITGGSERGKSAIISIIDYCLGSGSCRIPTRNIKEYTEWFGVLFSLENGNELLLVRREPGEQQASGEMYMKEGINVDIPVIIESNYNVENVKKRLNNIARLSDILVDDENNTAFDSNPSFRDFTSFLFQPQYIIANQSVLFYRADSFEHREKLKNIFPYILNAVDNEYLSKRDELKSVERKIAVLERQLERKKRISSNWLGQVRGYYTQAVEFGLLSANLINKEGVQNNEYLEALRSTILPEKEIIPIIQIEDLVNTAKRINELTSKEEELAYRLNSLKHRQELLKRLNESSRIFRDNLLNQSNRIEAASWISNLANNNADKNECPFCGTETNRAVEYLNNIKVLRKQIIAKEVTLSDNYTVTSGEYIKISKEVESIVAELNGIRDELRILKTESSGSNKYIHTLSSINQFIGKVSAEIENFDALNVDDGTEAQLAELVETKQELEKIVNAEIVKSRILSAKSKITTSIKHYADIFRAENRGELIEFNHKDLMLNFLMPNGRREALYEIGSGHNYMAYHIATLLGFHEFFLSLSHHPTPSFIIFDQPTQVYFPESTDNEESGEEDLSRVKRIFEALNSAIDRTEKKLQIIVLEHVGKSAWEGFEHISLLKRWRDGEEDPALIPMDWIES
ncbi:MAG: DUF3732 domain-containing protein [Flavipsychrobacter sp.]|nr:DUF3732 domain-containing protein [Flavipsychrobacter sp.]